MTLHRTPVTMTGLVTIETHYLGPTNYRGSRIVAQVGPGRPSDGHAPRIVMSYDHELDGPDNHAKAACRLANQMKSDQRWPEDAELIGGATAKGYAFVLVLEAIRLEDAAR